MKKRIIIPIITAVTAALILFITANLIIVNPGKLCAFSFLIDRSKSYIVCDYIEVTGFYWRITEDKDGKYKDRFVKLTGVDADGTNLVSNSIYYGDNKFVFYGEFTETPHDAFYDLFKNDNYLTFEVEDWNVLAPIKKNIEF